MATKCVQCGKHAATETTITGRQLCSRCNDELHGLTVGTIASGGNVGASISTSGWYQRIKAARRGRAN